MKYLYDKCREYIYFLLIAAIAFFLYNYLFYPGIQTPDTISMLRQAKGLELINNWHPPFLIYIWRQIYNLFGSEAAIWQCQIIFYIFAVFCLALTIKSKKIAITSFLLLLIFPSIFNTMGALWKDCWSLIINLLCAAITIKAINSKKYLYAAMAALLIASSFTMRYDSILITFIMGIFISYAIYLQHKEKNIYNYFKFVSYIISIVIITISLNHFTQKISDIKLNPWLTPVIWDIAGTKYYAKNGVASKNYNCESSDPLIFTNNPEYNITLPAGDNIINQQIQSKYYRKLWFDTILENPMAYLQHRFCVMKNFISLGNEKVNFYFPESEETYAYVSNNMNSSFSLIYRSFHAARNGALYRYWYYILFSTLIILIAIIQKRITLPLIVIYLSLLGCLSRFLIIPAGGFRYGIWMVPATIILAALYFEQILAKRNSK